VNKHPRLTENNDHDGEYGQSGGNKSSRDASTIA
jgi:hypothetical protein